MGTAAVAPSGDLVDQFLTSRDSSAGNSGDIVDRFLAGQGNASAVPGAPVPKELQGIPDSQRIGSQSAQQIIQQQTGIHPYSNPAAQAVAGVGRAAKNMVEAPYQAAKSAFTAPSNSDEQTAKDQWGPLGLAFERNIVEPAQAATHEAKQFYSEGHPLLAAGAELGAIPMLGPAGANLGQRAAAGDIPGAVTEGLTYAVAPKAGEEVAPYLRSARSAVQDIAAGDPDSAALRGLRVPENSPRALNILQAVAGARPYLQGVNSLEDLQARIPLAKGEIWRPYRQTIDAMGDTPVHGPQGLTTIRDLEDDRLQTSALLRKLKSGNPEALQLAQQKGLTEAQLLNHEKAIKAAMDPYLKAAGINPVEIRARFANVAKIGSRISGKTTLNGRTQPYGFGKITDLSWEHPLQAPQQLLSGVRDLAAGRPPFMGKPTDIGIREAFRNAPPKPDLGEFAPPIPIARRLTAGPIITPPPAPEAGPSIAQPAASILVRNRMTGRMGRQYVPASAPYPGAPATIPEPLNLPQIPDTPKAPPLVLNGQIVPARGYDPSAHQFSSEQWKSANPSGNVGAARAKAIGLGYEVVD